MYSAVVKISNMLFCGLGKSNKRDGLREEHWSSKGGHCFGRGEKEKKRGSEGITGRDIGYVGAGERRAIQLERKNPWAGKT